MMKLSINKVSGLLGGILLSVISANSWAVANCSFDAGATQTETVTLPKNGSRTIRIPLSVRYLQTAANPTPGMANGKVTFTINYY